MGIGNALKALLEGGATRKTEHPLRAAVRTHMGEADEDTQRIVTAVTGLLACVAYADHEYTEGEEEKVREVLSRFEGLYVLGLDAICSLLREEMATVIGGGDHIWVRDLRALTNRQQRIDLLDVLMELSSADDGFSLAEVNYLRRLATALGLRQEEYNAVQTRHRDSLSSLR